MKYQMIIKRIKKKICANKIITSVCKLLESVVVVTLLIKSILSLCNTALLTQVSVKIL